MRHLMLIAVLAACTQLAPIAYAQSDSGTKGGTYGVDPSGARAGFVTAQLNPTNCGTPDEPKPCGPMPRRALQTYPGR